MDVQHAGPQMMPNPLLAAGGLQPGQPPNAADLAALVAERTQGRGGFRADWRAQPAQHAPQGYSLRRELLTLTDEQIDELEREGVLNDDTYGRMRYDWKEWARPQQLAPINPNWRTWLILAGRGWGKAQDSLSTPIPTPTGWTMLCDIRVGDTVFDESGRPCRVTATFDTMPKTAYRLTFSDGTAINTCDEHQWVTWTHAERKAFLRSPYEDHACFPAEWPAWRLRRLVGHSLSREVVEQALALSRAGMSARRIAKQLGVCRQSLAPHIAAGAFIKRQPRVYDDSPGPRIRTTQEIVDTLTHGKRGDTNHSIPLALPLQLPEADLPLDPYVLGYWLGDGDRSQGSFACDPLDQPSLIAQLVRCGLQPHMGCNPIVVLTYGLMTLLRRVGVLGDKHVPAIYLRGSVEQRLALLRGLMDSDGYADPSSGNVEFCNTNKRLIDAVTELARSLGQKPVVVEGRATLNGVDCGPKWRVTWTPNTNSGVPFLLRRKAAVVEAKQSRTAAQSLRNHQRMIVKAERIDPVPMRCLTVDGTHSMFLCGEGMIPTHNTRTGAEWIKAQVDRGAKRIALVARTAADARDVMLEGEALALDTPIATPDGWTTLGALKVGDALFAGDGAITRVAALSPIWTDRPCYAVATDLAAPILADARHRWVTSSRAERRKDRSTRGSTVRTTEEIAATLYKRFDMPNHEIALHGALQLPAADLPIPPYTLGAWLGDGDTRGKGQFTCHPDDAATVAEIERDGYAVTKCADRHGWYIRKLGVQLRAAGLAGNKHIPDVYLRASFEQRLALLQGLMDTDGYVSARGQCSFDNTNAALVAAVRELLLTLGLKPGRVLERDAGEFLPVFRVVFTLAAVQVVPFRLARKVARCAKRSVASRGRLVRHVDRIDSIPTRCIQVEHPDGTFLAGRDLVVTHNSGLLNLYPEHERPLYQPSKRRVTFANGAVATLFSAKEPDLLRGPQFDCAWADELASWQDPEAWSNLMFALRLGQNPQVVVTTTPRPTPLIKALLNLPSTVVDTGNSYDNIENMAPAFFDEILGRYEGTRLGRQEIYAELLDDAPGALWKREAMIDAHRIGRTDVPPLYRIVVAIDPAVSANKDSAETGIIVAGVAANGHAYVLDDVSVREATPTEWATAAVKAYKLRSADRFVAEINNGGDLVEHTIRTVLPDAPYTPVRASRGKLIRAEPVSALYEQGRVHHVGMFGELEDQLCVAGDTLVETESGPRMISTITPGMRVWTRAGLRRVTHAWQASPAAPVWRVTTAGGRTLVATSDHPIYTSNKGFCPVGKLEIGDEVVAWNSASSAPANMARSLTGMGRAGIWAKQATISTFGAAVASMSQSLKLHLVQFRQGITSTIAMATRSTTIPQTWLRLAQPTICVNTGATIPTLPRHTELLFGTSISAARCSGPNGNGPQPATWFARAVAQRINRRGCVPSSAPPRVASDSIIAVTPLPLHIPVYDLTVEGEHEFFANGVIISNCNWEPGDPSPDRLDALVWAITELLLDGDGPPEEELPIDTGLMSMTKANDWARF